MVLLAWLFFFEIATSVVVYVKRNQFNGTLDDSFTSMLYNYEKNKEAWDFAQTEVNFLLSEIGKAVNFFFLHLSSCNVAV